MTPVGTDIAEEVQPWWQSLPVLTEDDPKTPYDLGDICGHSRDRHDAQGQCRIYEHAVQMGGDEGQDRKTNDGKRIIIPPSQWTRPACKCPGETVWHLCAFPSGMVWDTLEDADFEADPDARYDANGRYVWWVVRKKKET